MNTENNHDTMDDSATNNGERQGAKLWLRTLPLTKLKLTTRFPTSFPELLEEQYTNPNMIPLGTRRGARNDDKNAISKLSCIKPDPSILPLNARRKKSVKFMDTDVDHLPSPKVGRDHSPSNSDSSDSLSPDNDCPLIPEQLQNHLQIKQVHQQDDFALLEVPVKQYERNLFQRIEEELSPFEWEHFGKHFAGYTDSVFHPVIVDQVVQSQFDRFCGGYTLDAVDRKHTKAVMGKRGACADAKGKFKFHH